jgi:hypothetical protein
LGRSSAESSDPAIYSPSGINTIPDGPGFSAPDDIDKHDPANKKHPVINIKNFGDFISPPSVAELFFLLNLSRFQTDKFI